jgi:hypothetical protein
MSFGTSITAEQPREPAESSRGEQELISEFNRLFDYAIDPKLRQPVEMLWAMQGVAGLRGRTDIADKLINLIVELKEVEA